MSSRIVDALVINAGVGGRFVDSLPGDQVRLVDLNVRSSVHLARRLLPDMVTRGAGRILFASSIAAVLPGRYQAAYNASNAFLLSFSEVLCEELKNSGITITALMPGPTDTEFFEHADLTDAKLGRASKDDPALVAKKGFEAMMAGKHRVVAGSASNEAQVAAANVLPDPALAAQHAPRQAADDLPTAATWNPAGRAPDRPIRAAPNGFDGCRPGIPGTCQASSRSTSTTIWPARPVVSSSPVGWPAQRGPSD